MPRPAHGESALSVDERVRRRLRELRTEQGLTLQQVARRANLDVSTLSRLESGKRRLSLDHLPGLADALAVTVDELLVAAPAADPRVRNAPIDVFGLTMWRLNHHGTGQRFHAYRVHVPASRRRPPTQLPCHDGHDWMYVLEGRLRLVLGEQDLTVEPGETVEFVTTVPHWFGAVDGPVELLAIFGPHGADAHVHTVHSASGE